MTDAELAEIEARNVFDCDEDITALVTEVRRLRERNAKLEVVEEEARNYENRPYHEKPEWCEVTECKCLVIGKEVFVCPACVNGTSYSPATVVTCACGARCIDLGDFSNHRLFWCRLSGLSKDPPAPKEEPKGSAPNSPKENKP